MNEMGKFKKGFFLGRLIWLTGKQDLQRRKKIKSWLSACNVQGGEVWHINSEQFVDAVSNGFPKAMIAEYEVIQVHGFEKLRGAAALDFLRCIRTFRDLQMGLAMRMLLLSEAEVSVDLKGFSEFSPIEIFLSEPNEDPGALNERVHALLEVAMSHSKIPVKRISEKAGIFLEMYSPAESDADVVKLLVQGLQSSDGETLRFRDLFPKEQYESSFRGDPETHCN